LDFQIAHELDIPRDAVELALVSPTLLDKLRVRMPGLDGCEQKSHSLDREQLERIWYFRVNVPLPKFAKDYLAKDMLAWDQSTSYNLATHEGTWTIHPAIKPKWKKFFSASGTYALLASGQGTRRVVTGAVTLNIPAIGSVIEKLIIGEVRKKFEAEADTLMSLATLA
jgi:Protein of unknown function (DUF2505)